MIKESDRRALLEEAVEYLESRWPMPDALRNWLIQGLRNEAEGAPWPKVGGRGHAVSRHVLSFEVVAEMKRLGYDPKTPEEMSFEEAIESAPPCPKAVFKEAVHIVSIRHQVDPKTVRNALAENSRLANELGSLELISGARCLRKLQSRKARNSEE